MPAVAVEATTSTGHSCFPPSSAIGPYSIKTKINGKFIQLQQYTMYAAHTCDDNDITHTSAQRKVTTGSTKVFVEGKPVARIGDPIDCGDAVSVGSSDTFAGG